MAAFVVTSQSGNDVRSSASEDRTRHSFGLLWRSSLEPRYPSHLARILALVGRDILPSQGRVLDAGCGDGRDLEFLSAERADLDPVGMDLSDGVLVARERTRHRVPLVQASVVAPPFRDRSFALVYSYGVLHHTVDPVRSFHRLARLVAPGGRILVYVYSDLQEEPLMRCLLRLVNSMRLVTTRLPHQLLLGICRMAAPIAFVTCALPAWLLRRTNRADLAARIPLNWVDTPFGAAGDLYDRFSAPIESRHSPAELERWAREAGLAEVTILRQPDARGWVMTARAVGASE